jgi:hypothetical protein
MKTSILLASILTCVFFTQPIHGSMVGYWAFNEGAGTNIADLSGSGNNGTIVNIKTNTWTTGISGSALYFDGTTGANSTYVKVPDSASLRITSAISFAAWVRLDNTNRDAPIIDKEAPSGAQCYWFGARGTSANTYDTASAGNFGALLNLNGNTGTDGWSLWGRNKGKLVQGNWVHLAVTWDGATVRYYTNGVQLPNTVAFSGTLNVSSAFLAIGENSIWNSTAFQGVIDEARLYNNALTGSEVAALATAPNANLTIQPIVPAVKVTWPTLTNMNYQPQWLSDLKTNTWNNYGSATLGTGSNSFLIDPMSSNNCRFYRVLVRP